MTASEKEYGGALYELAAEEHCEDEVLESIGLVSKMFAEEPSYYSWMMNGDFPLYTKKVITAIRLRELNNKE